MKRFLLILFFLLAVTGISNATTIDYETQLDTDGVLTTKLSGAIIENFNSGSLTWNGSGSGTVLTAPAASTAAPFNNDLMTVADSTYYLSIPNPSSTGSFQFDFNTDYTYFGLFWGSIDDYNKISFFQDGSEVESWSGSDLPNPSVANGNQSSDTSNLYVNFYGVNSGLGFDSVVLSSTQFAFEVDNLAVGTAPVPEPATMMLFGIGLLGLAGVSRRKK